MADDPVLSVTAARDIIENEVERLIGLLDSMDADDGLEDDGSAEDDGTGEPSLGATEYHRSNGGWFNAAPAQTSHDVDLEEDSDDEPWLGAFERHPRGDTIATQIDPQLAPMEGEIPCLSYSGIGSQDQWSAGTRDDREWDDEREPDTDEGSHHPTDWAIQFINLEKGEVRL